MKIPRHLPQFSGSKALVVVAGTKSAKIYVACDGEISFASFLKNPTSVYSDREGYFKSGGGGKNFGSGAVYESRRRNERKEFASELRETLLHIERVIDVDELVLFCPRHVRSLLLRSIPAGVKKKIASSCNGNYLHEHPLSLLEKVERRKSSGLARV